MSTSRLVTLDCDYVQPQLAASYLRVQDGEAAFIETGTARNLDALLAGLDAEGVAREAVRYVIVTHVHLDHAGGASALMGALPNATLLAHPRAARHLIDPSKLVASARAVYGAARFDSLYGTIAPVAAERVRALDDGADVPFGAGSLRFVHTRGHANHHFVVVDPSASAVFTGDTFGLAYPRLQRAGRFAFPSTSPTDFDAIEARASIEKVRTLGMERACLTHFGAVTDLDAVAAQLTQWIDLSESLLTQSLAQPANEAEAWIRARLTDAMEDAARAAGLTLDEGDRALTGFDIDLNAQGLAFAAAKKRV
jgi:glyoxylase-like metal-dependent hydrolase (beta-lactamase superfamily II)